MAGEYVIEASALRFTGGSGRATINFVEALALGESFTLEVWVRPDALEGNAAVLGVHLEAASETGSPAARPLLLWLENGKPTFSFSADRSNAQAIDLSLTQEWCHIAIVRNGAQMTLGLRPGPQASRSFQLTPREAGSLSMKKLIAGSLEETGASLSSISGAFAELRVWNTARTNQEIDTHRSRQLIGNEEGLVGYWMLDEESGDVIVDSSVNSNQGRVTGGSWDFTSGLQLTVSPTEARAAFLKDTKLPTLKLAYDQMQEQQKDLVIAVPQLEAQRQLEEAKYGKMLEDKVTLEQKHQALAERRSAIEKAKAERLQALTATKQITLGNFIERLQDKLAKSRAGVAREHGRNVQGLDSVAMKVKMVPGYGGEGLQLPQPGMRTESGRFSTLILRLAARREIEKVEPKLATVPELAGATELYARRVLGAAGFRVEVMYQAAERPEQHGRVLTLLFNEKQPDHAELDNVITLVIGQHH